MSRDDVMPTQNIYYGLSMPKPKEKMTFNKDFTKDHEYIFNIDNVQEPLARFRQIYAKHAHDLSKGERDVKFWHQRS